MHSSSSSARLLEDGLSVNGFTTVHTAPVKGKGSEQALSWAALLPIFVAAAANVLFGYENSNVSGAKTSFAHQFNIDSTSPEYGFITSGMPIGATFGCIAAGFMQDGLGRRISLIIASLGYIGAAAISTFATGFPMLAAGRVVTGVFIGILSSTVPLYISELSPPHVRGRLVTVNQVCICTGILVGYVVCMATPSEPFSNVSQWSVVFAAATPLAAALAVMFMFVTPYSPRWLMSKGRVEEARAVLLQLRGDVAAADREVDDIQRLLDEVASTSRASMFAQRHVKWSIALGVILSFIQQWTGCNAVNAYAPDIFNAAGFNASSSLVQSTYIGVAKLAFVIVALAIMDKVGRRSMLLGGTAGMAVALFLLAASLQITQTSSSPPAGLNYVSEFSLIFYMATFEMSLGPVLWLLLSELYPLSIRGVAMSVGSTACWLFTFSVTQLFPILRGGLTLYGTFYLFASMCVLSTLWMWWFVPETRGKSLEEIEDMLKEGRTA